MEENNLMTRFTQLLADLKAVRDGDGRGADTAGGLG